MQPNVHAEAETVFSEVTTLLLSDTIRSMVLPGVRVFLLTLLLPSELLTTLRCIIRTGIPPKLKSSFSDFVKNLRSVSNSWAFPVTNATNVGGLAFTWVKYFIFGWDAWSFQECRLITYTITISNYKNTDDFMHYPLTYRKITRRPSDSENHWNTSSHITWNEIVNMFSLEAKLVIIGVYVICPIKFTFPYSEKIFKNKNTAVVFKLKNVGICSLGTPWWYYPNQYGIFQIHICWSHFKYLTQLISSNPNPFVQTQ